MFSTSSPQAAQADGEGGLWSVHHTLSLLLLPPWEEDSSHSSSAPAWGPVLHELLQRESFPWAAALHKLPQRGSLPTGCSPSGTGGSSVGPPQGHKPCQQTCSGVGSSPRGHKSWQEPAPARAPHRVTAAFRHPPAPAWSPLGTAGKDLLHCGPLRTAGAQPASPWSSQQAAGESLLQCLEHLLLSFTDPGVCRVVALRGFFGFFSPSCVIPDSLTPSLTDSALASSRSRLAAGPGWHWLCWT